MQDKPGAWPVPSRALLADKRMSRQPKKRTGDVLVERGIIDRDQLAITLTQIHAMSERGQPARIGEVLLKNSFVTPGQVAEAVTVSSGADQTSLFTQYLPSHVCKEIKVIPRIAVGTALHVKSWRPLNDQEKAVLLDSASLINGRQATEIVVEAALQSEILAGLSNMSAQTLERFGDILDSLKREPENSLLMQKAMDSLFVDAVHSRASDIHVRRQQDALECWVAYRVDGELVQKYLLPGSIAGALTTRIKTDSGMDSSESRLAQDGRLEIRASGKRLDVRVSARPSEGGERLVMRLLDPTSLKSIDELFPSQPGITEKVRITSKNAGKSGGLMLVSGATGQGKSTSLYAMLRAMPRHKSTILTCENPVEYRMPFVEQVAYNPAIETSMGNVLRSFLRQDPDVIIVGETRDEDTAETTLHAAESGHFVATTVHARDALQTFQRFVDMLSEEHRKDGMLVLANHLRLIVNQRLGRRVCTCAVDVTQQELDAHEGVLELLGVTGADLLGKIKMAVGCHKCNHSGYFGRVALADALYIPENETLRADMITLLRDSGSIKAALSLPGVEHFSRIDACRDVMFAGIMDLAAIGRVMGVAH